MKKTQKVLVKLLLFSEDQKKIMLLFNNKGHYWDLPGGHLEFEESPEEGLTREVKEEIGIEVTITKLSSVCTIILNLTDRPSPEMRHCIVLVFIGKIEDQNQTITLGDPDIVDYQWYEVNKIIKSSSLNILSPLKEQICLALQKIPGRINKKFYIREGELDAYRIVEN